MKFATKNIAYLISMSAYILCTLIALLSLPGANVVTSLLGFTCVTFISTNVYRSLRSYSRVGEIALFFASLVMTLGIVANMHYFTVVSGGTCDSPVLENFDANQIWEDSLAHYGASSNFTAVRALFGVYSAVLLRVFGLSLTVLLIANMFMIQSALVVGSLIAHNLTGDSRRSGYALCAAAAVCYLLTMGTLMLRDAWVIFAMALTAYGMTSTARYGWIATLVGAFLVSTIRVNYAWAIVVGLVLMHFYRDAPQRNIKRTAALIAAVIFFWSIPTILAITPTVAGVFDKEVLNEYYSLNHPQQYAYGAIVGNFMSFPLYKKILFLPVSAVVQFLIPFPWNFSRDLVFGYSEFYAHISYPWYIFGGIVLYYICFVLRRAPRKIALLTLWALFCWAVPCVLYGGTVSRYGLTSVILLAPCVAEVWANHLRRRSFVVFAACFVAIMATVLPICYYLQTAHY